MDLPAPEKYMARTLRVVDLSRSSGGISTQRNFWNGASSEEVHFLCAGVVALVIGSSKFSRLRSGCSASPSRRRQIVNPAISFVIRASIWTAALGMFSLVSAAPAAAQDMM